MDFECTFDNFLHVYHWGNCNSPIASSWEVNKKKYIKKALSFSTNEFSKCHLRFHNHPSWQSWCYDWLLGCKLQLITFNLLFVSDLLLSVGITLGSHWPQWFHNPSSLGWRFIIILCVKWWHLNSHEGWLCLLLTLGCWLLRMVSTSVGWLVFIGLISFKF
jgi:hypothetical protein